MKQLQFREQSRSDASSVQALNSLVTAGIGRPLIRLGAFLTLALGLCFPSIATADDPPLHRVEEDWVLVIDEPELNRNSPQIVNVISPLSHINGLHIVFELNHITLGNYAPGGMQLQCWHGDQDLAWSNHPDVSPLSVNNETLTYTMAMELTGGKLIFEVVEGNSETWGEFGGQGYLKFLFYTNATRFTDYSPLVSVKSSRVGFAANRVKKFALKEVRYYSNGELYRTDSTERIVHQLEVDSSGEGSSGTP